MQTSSSIVRGRRAQQWRLLEPLYAVYEQTGLKKGVYIITEIYIIILLWTPSRGMARRLLVLGRRFWMLY